MSHIDIAVDKDLAALFVVPNCADLSIPLPKPLKLQLPTGGEFSAFADISKGIPTDCSMTFSLMLQIAPFLAMSDCLLKILKLLKPLIDVVKSLAPPPDPLKLPAAIEDFVQAAIDLAPCLLVPTPLNILPFIRDLLCLILRVLNCFVSQMNSIITIAGRLGNQAQPGSQQRQSGSNRATPMRAGKRQCAGATFEGVAGADTAFCSILPARCSRSPGLRRSSCRPSVRKPIWTASKLWSKPCKKPSV